MKPFRHVFAEMIRPLERLKAAVRSHDISVLNWTKFGEARNVLTRLRALTLPPGQEGVIVKTYIDEVDTFLHQVLAPTLFGRDIERTLLAYGATIAPAETAAPETAVPPKRKAAREATTEPTGRSKSERAAPRKAPTQETPTSKSAEALPIRSVLPVPFSKRMSLETGHFPDHYAIVGVTIGAPPQVVKAACEAVRTKWAADAQRLRLIDKACAVLTDRKARVAYNKQLEDMGRWTGVEMRKGDSVIAAHKRQLEGLWSKVPKPEPLTYDDCVSTASVLHDKPFAVGYCRQRFGF